MIKKELTVDSILRVGSQIIQSTNPEITFESETEGKFKISYVDSFDKFTIEEIESGIAFEIKDGEIYLPQYANGMDKNLVLDANGKIVDELKPLNRYNKYNFSILESFQGYTKTRTGIHFTTGTVLTGVNAFLLDNNSMTGDDSNSITVNILRRSKTSNVLPDELIYQMVGNNTAQDVFSSFSNNSVITTGSNIIDNDNFIYAIEILYCDDCDFREIIILE